MGSKLSVDESVRVVVVGGGFAGIAAANQLKSNGIPFVLVDMKDAFHHNVAALRASVESGFARKTFISYEATYQDSFKQGKVLGINLQTQQVLLESNEELHFSHLILATGSNGPFPGKFNQVISMDRAIQKYEDLVKEVQKAKHVVVVGGGSAGVEMAAEVKTEYPDKEVWDTMWFIGSSVLCQYRGSTEVFGKLLHVPSTLQKECTLKNLSIH
ncbi:hypothetical protein FKM82_015246 [Ascaphus truei]